MRGGALTTGAAALAACVLALVATSVAQAGTIWVTDGNMNAGQTGALQRVQLLRGACRISRRLPGSCPMAHRRTSGRFPPATEFVLDDDCAPRHHDQSRPGRLTGDVTATQRSPSGLVAGDFWKSNSQLASYGGSTLALRASSGSTRALEGSSNINSQNYGIQLVCTHSASQGPCAGNPSIRH